MSRFAFGNVNQGCHRQGEVFDPNELMTMQFTRLVYEALPPIGGTQRRDIKDIGGFVVRIAEIHIVGPYRYADLELDGREADKYEATFDTLGVDRRIMASTPHVTLPPTCLAEAGDDYAVRYLTIMENPDRVRGLRIVDDIPMTWAQGPRLRPALDQSVDGCQVVDLSARRTTSQS